jgi:predicted negative regulator of RcsB-dependent stress response
LAQHISRRELKKDEVRDTFERGAEALLSHQQLSLYLLIAAVVIALGIFGWRTYTQRQTVKAFAAYDDAMEIFQAPVGAPPAPGEPNYTDNTKKFTDAEQKFADVARQYPRTRAGELAHYYVALSFEKLDKNAEAKAALQPLTGSSDPEVAAMAKFELAGLDDRMGQGDDAVKLYQDLIAKPSVLVPKPVVMLALADHYAPKDPAQAAKLYTQIKTDYPDTPIAEQADQALSLLPSKS